MRLGLHIFGSDFWLSCLDSTQSQCRSRSSLNACCLQPADCMLPGGRQETSVLCFLKFQVGGKRRVLVPPEEGWVDDEVSGRGCSSNGVHGTSTNAVYKGKGWGRGRTKEGCLDDEQSAWGCSQLCAAAHSSVSACTAGRLRGSLVTPPSFGTDLTMFAFFGFFKGTTYHITFWGFPLHNYSNIKECSLFRFPLSARAGGFELRKCLVFSCMAIQKRNWRVDQHEQSCKSP